MLLATAFNYSSICRSFLQIGADGESRTLWGKGARQFTKLLLSLLSHIGGNEVAG